MADSLLTRAELRQRFVTAATEKFAANVPDFAALRRLVNDRGGVFVNDHAAVRIADPRVTELLVRVAALLDLFPDRRYSFPAKKLESFDLQVPGEDASQFKLFVSEVDIDAFPPEAADAIREDAEINWAAADYQALIEQVEQAESAGGLVSADADALVEAVVEGLLTRSGPPIRRAVLEQVAAVSGEAASALALGADFNHVTIDVLAAGYTGIEAMVADMQARGFRMLPAIQGAPGTKLRQTATMAATMATPVLEEDGSIGHAQTEKQFVEIIERSTVPDESGRPKLASNGEPLIYKHFLAANAEKIFDAASTRAGLS
ncbi:MAG: DUF1338 domain-containing protein [Nevskiales bacterium]|nr:DUF1338 domain-containing protein [Nevskiales bacterium]